MLRLITACLLFATTVSHAQKAIQWDGHYQLQLSDFQSPTSQIGDVNIVSLYAPVSFDFSFYMSSAEFMFTRNFNDKVSCSFKPQQASIVATDTLMANSLVNLARYEFDLSELYARKFRKLLYENKGAFSNTNFFQPLYDRMQKEYSEQNVTASKLTDLGRNEEKLKELHEAVQKEITELSDFCKACKPQKKKK